MFPMSIHTAQPVVADRRNQTEAAASRHRLARSLARNGERGRSRGDAPDRAVAADLARRIPPSAPPGPARCGGDAHSPGENDLGGDEGLESFLCRSGRAARPIARGGGLSAAAGESSAVVVGGEAGVGKTRPGPSARRRGRPTGWRCRSGCPRPQRYLHRPRRRRPAVRAHGRDPPHPGRAKTAQPAVARVRRPGRG